jgi:hypothetical protein
VSVRKAVAVGSSVALALLLAGAPALSQTQAQGQAELAPDTQIDVSTKAPEGKTSEPDTTLPAPPAEAPPVRPRHKGIVVESTIGMLAFAGQFRHVSPPAVWLHGQVGYEIFNWLMVFGESELALTDTSEAQSESQSMGFPIFGFGGGARGTIHMSERVALFLQGDLGEMEAMVPQGSLAGLGFGNAENFNLYFGGRVGVEWYQIDRHMALVAQGGVRDAQGFAKSEAFVPANDTPLMWDAGLGLRYTFPVH